MFKILLALVFCFSQELNTTKDFGVSETTEEQQSTEAIIPKKSEESANQDEDNSTKYKKVKPKKSSNAKYFKYYLNVIVTIMFIATLMESIGRIYKP